MGAVWPRLLPHAPPRCRSRLRRAEWFVSPHLLIHAKPNAGCFWRRRRQQSHSRVTVQCSSRAPKRQPSYPVAVMLVRPLRRQRWRQRTHADLLLA